MVKKIFLGIAFFGLSILFTNSVSAASINPDYEAELNKVCKPSHCIVPVPTLVDPDEDIIKIDENFYLTGLTWNDTKIDIYVDDEYQGRATVVNDDDSDTANFYFLIKNDSLLEGKHNWEVIAWTENMRKRSYVSVENSFTIENYFLAPILERVSKDIDGNNWIIGNAGNNSIVSIYVDNVYQGQVRTDGNFNYNIGQLSPGLHTFYALAREVDTGKTSKRSNILSEQTVVEDSDQDKEEKNIDEEPVENIAQEEVLPELEDQGNTVTSTELEETILEPELESEDQISSISEEKEEEDGISIQDNESQDNVNVTETENHDVEVGVVSHEESQDQLVVDDQKSGLNESNEEEQNEENTVTEELQTATPNEKLSEMLTEELNIVEKQERNRKVGLWLLIILIVIVVASSFLSGKKTKTKLEDSEKEDDDSNSHQGDLFNKE